VGDYLLAGTCSGKVKAMHDERGKKIKVAGPSTPVSVLGLDGAPQAGDKFNVMDDEREAKDIASKRTQLQREQNVRTQRHITLDEIGRRIALGDFKELNIILKGDVDGSVEALTDSFQKLSDLKDAMEGMLSPEMREEITGNAEIRETFKISKIGTIAGCMVTSGKIFRNSGIRIIRDSVVVYTGELATLKRFKDDAKEVAKGYDCGMQIKNYNDIKIGDVIEAYQEVAVKKTLK